MAKKFDFLSPGVEIREIDQSFLPQEEEATGPIIIGRTLKGPANKPVKVKNLDDFVSVFGKPVPGGAGSQGDVWRDGNTAGPTYASYAAQSWLASEQSPVTIVRLAGESHPSATEDTNKAGWKLSGSTGKVQATHGSAYGLFLIASSSANNDNTGSLAAVFYVNDGMIGLTGEGPLGTSLTGKAATLIANKDTNSHFEISIFNDTSGTAIENIVFDFNRNSSDYIRNVFNTNPQIVNDERYSSSDRKNYWLGESFLREVDGFKDLTAGQLFGILLPLESGSVNWSYHKEGAQEAESGWVLSQKSTGQEALFRFKSLHVGEDIQKNYMIAIENISEPSNPLVNKFGTFTIAIKNTLGNTVERYTNLTLNPSDPNYVGKRIGTQYLRWNDTDRRYKTYGEYQNQSNIVYLEITNKVQAGNAQGMLPAGFKGPVRPQGFSLMSGSSTVQGIDAIMSSSAAQFVNAFVEGSSSVPNTALATFHKDFAFLTGFGTNGKSQLTASFTFPSIPLRTNGTQGNAANPYKVYYGIRPAVSDTSTSHDPDYCDYVRRLAVGAQPNSDTGAPLAGFEHSFIFSLDDLHVITGSNQVNYVSGSYKTSGNNADADVRSFTSVGGSGSFGALLDLGLRQFLMPLHGGSEGFDILEQEPFRNDLMTSLGTTDQTNYLRYTLNKALDSVSDPEVVPANMLLVPGVRNADITDRMISIAEQRKDVLAIIDLENDYLPLAERDTADTETNSLGDVSEAISTLKLRNLNSSYACTFYPWVQISDNLNGSQLVWIPPSVAALGAFGRSQAQSELWFAPAGFNRGGLGNLGGARGPKVIQARQRLDSSERDSLYEVNINPIATFPSEGVVVFGQKTLQADASALDRINVRRLVLYLKEEVSKISRNLLFDQNVSSTWNRFKAQVNPVLSNTRARFGLTDYKLVLDDTTTTADLIDRNIMYAKIYIKPARAIEYIVVDFVITNTGADFV